MRAIIYGRTASEGRTENSLSYQVTECTEYAARNGWQVTAIFTDPATSGHSGERPGLQQALRRADKGDVDCVIATDSARLARDVFDIAVLYERMAKAGARIVTLAGGDMPIGAGSDFPSNSNVGGN